MNSNDWTCIIECVDEGVPLFIGLEGDPKVYEFVSHNGFGMFTLQDGHHWVLTDNSGFQQVPNFIEVCETRIMHLAFDNDSQDKQF